MFAMLVDDVFELTGRGIVVSGYINEHKHTLKVYDCLYDFYGNQFWVKGIEMFRRASSFLENYDSEHVNIAFLIETNGKDKEYFKGKLLTSIFNVALVFPANHLDKSLVDFDFEKEYEMFSNAHYLTLLIDIEKFLIDGTLDLPLTKKIQRVIFRGNKLSSKTYRKLYDAMASQNYYLDNTPEQYEYCGKNHTENLQYERFVGNSDGKINNEELHAFYFNGEIVNEYDESGFGCNGNLLSDDEKKWLIGIAEKIDINFIAFFLKRCPNGETMITEICDGQTAAIPFLPFEKFCNTFDCTLLYCKDNYRQLDPVPVDENCKLENITEFNTPVGSIIVIDENKNRIPFSVNMISDCPYSVYADDNERVRYYIKPTNNYGLRITSENLSLGRKYKAIFSGGPLSYGGSDERSVCISKSISQYSIAFGAYVPNDSILNPENYEEYLIEISNDFMGYDFELIDKNGDVWFEVSWLQNNDEPDKCLSACEFWVT